MTKYNSNPENYNSEGEEQYNRAIIESSLDSIYHFILEAYNQNQINELLELELDIHEHDILLHNQETGNYWNVNIIHKKNSPESDEIVCCLDRLTTNDINGYSLYLKSYVFDNKDPTVCANYRNKIDDSCNKGSFYINKTEEIDDIFKDILEPQYGTNGHKIVKNSIEIVSFDEAEKIRSRHCKFVMREFKDPCCCKEDHDRSVLRRIVERFI